MTREILGAVKARLTWEKIAALKTNVLFNEIHGLISEVERLTLERNAAVADLRAVVEQNSGSNCILCKYLPKKGEHERCQACGYGDKNKWEWRGVQEVGHEGN